MGTSLSWERVEHVFVTVAEGSGAVSEQDFAVYFDDLRQLGFTHFLTVAKGNPTLDAKSRHRILRIPGVRDVRLAVVYDGSPIVRGTTMVFSWFMPNVKILPAGSLNEAADYLGIEGALRREVLRVVPELQKRIGGGERKIVGGR